MEQEYTEIYLSPICDGPARSWSRKSGKACDDHAAGFVKFIRSDIAEQRIAELERQLDEINAEYCHAKLDEKGVPRAAHGGEIYNFYGRAKAWVDRETALKPSRP